MSTLPIPPGFAMSDKILDRIFMITERMVVFDAVDDVLEHIARSVVTLIQADAATIRVFDLKTGTLNVNSGFGMEEGMFTQPPVTVGEGIAGMVVKKGEPFVAPNFADVAEKCAAETVNLKSLGSVICMPMRTREGSLGCITVVRKNQNPYSANDQLLLNIFATEAVEAVEKARLIIELKRQATFDPLTNLLNKHNLIARLETEVERCNRHRQILSVIFIDLDNFKSCNDTLGHLMGDKLIHDVGRFLHGQCRVSDILGRFGGDEFVIVAAQTNDQGAHIFGERIRERMASHCFALDSTSAHDVKTTCSIGIASLPEHGKGAQELLDRADQALYASKRGGRNRVTIWSEELSPKPNP